jgi:hypothetical protein
LELIGANIVVCADGCGPFAGLAKRNKQTTILQWDCCVNDDDGEVNEPSLASDVGTADDRRMHHHLHHHYRQHTSCRGSRMFVCGDEMEMTEDVDLLQHQYTDATNKRKNIQSDARIR